jgi:hypothetical protein
MRTPPRREIPPKDIIIGTGKTRQAACPGPLIFHTEATSNRDSGRVNTAGPTPHPGKPTKNTYRCEIRKARSRDWTYD